MTIIPTRWIFSIVGESIRDRMFTTPTKLGALIKKFHVAMQGRKEKLWYTVECY